MVVEGPGIWIEDDGVDDFLASNVPKIERFLQALEQMEARWALVPGGELDVESCLSARMCDSWKTRRSWFNCAARRCIDVDVIHWETLQAGPLVRAKMELRTYRAEYAACFPKGSVQEVESILDEIALLFQFIQQSSKRHEPSAKPNLAPFKDQDMAPVFGNLHDQPVDVARQQKRTSSL